MATGPTSAVKSRKARIAVDREEGRNSDMGPQVGNSGESKARLGLFIFYYPPPV